MMLNAAVAMPSPSDRPTIVSRRIAGCRANRRTAYLRSTRASRRSASVAEDRSVASARWGPRREWRYHHRPGLEPETRHIVIQAPVRVDGAAIASASREELVQVGLHLGARLARHG